MGFFSKIFKGVKKTFKKIGKGIKSAFAKVGKFMGKIGIVGQIALGLMLPGIGGMLGKWAVTAMGSGNALVSAAGHFVNAAVNIGTKAGSVFKTVTEGVTKVIGETVGAALNKIPGAGDALKSITGGKLDITQKTFTTAFEAAGTAMTDVATAGRSLFSMDTLTANNKFGQKWIDETMTKINNGTPLPEITTPDLDLSGKMPEDFNVTEMPGNVDMTRRGIDLPPGQQSFVTPDLDLNGKMPEDFNVIEMPGNVDMTRRGVNLPPGQQSFVTPSRNNVFDNVNLDTDSAYDPSQGAFDTTQIFGEGTTSAAVEGPMGQGDFSRGMIDDAGTLNNNSLLAKSQETGFFEGVYNKGVQEFKDFTADPFAGASERVQSAIQTRALQAADLIAKPEYTSNQFSSNIQLSDDLSSTSIRTGRIENFDPRAYESSQNLFDLNPYGNTAIQIAGREQYLNRMQGVG